MTEEVGHELVGRPRQQLAGGRQLLDVGAFGQHRDAVAEQDGLVDVVGDEHDGLVQLALELQELLLQLGPHDRVDGAERLVHQQHGGIGGEGSRHTDALLLAARQLRRVPVGVRRAEPDQLEQLQRPRP